MNEKTIKIFGFLGTCLALGMFFALIEIALSNLKGDSNIFIQPTIVAINCTVWSFYAHWRNDKFLFWANLPGIFLGIFTVVSAFI